jgi:hypothetical protein
MIRYENGIIVPNQLPSSLAATSATPFPAIPFPQGLADEIFQYFLVRNEDEA